MESDEGDEDTDSGVSTTGITVTLMRSDADALRGEDGCTDAALALRPTAKAEQAIVRSRRNFLFDFLNWNNQPPLADSKSLSYQMQSLDQRPGIP